MPRRISCAMTVDAVRDRTKTVTRRHVDTWKTLKVGDRLTVVEKAMGLPKGARQVVLAEVEVIDVRVEPLGRIGWEGAAGTAAEGLAHLTPAEFAQFWLEGHGYRWPTTATVLCRRIQWVYR